MGPDAWPTPAILTEAWAMAENAMNAPCGSGRNPHVLSPADWERGHGRCMNCGAEVQCHDR